MSTGTSASWPTAGCWSTLWESSPTGIAERATGFVPYPHSSSTSSHSPADA